MASVASDDHVKALEAQLAQLESLPESEARDAGIAAVQGVVELYGKGFAHVVSLLPPDILARLIDDDLISHLLLVHDLHPVDVRVRVEDALESVRPYLATHGGNVELLSVSEGVAHLRLEGTCRGCPSSTATLKQSVEQAIFRVAPDLVRVDAEGTVAAPQLISAESLACPLP